MATHLVVLVGETARILRQARDLLATGGAVVVLAPSLDAVQEWLGGGLAVEQPSVPQPIRVRDLEIDTLGHQARWRGQTLDLSEQDLRLLAALAEQPGRACSFAELTATVWGVSYYGGSGPVHAAIHRLRSKLADAGVELDVHAVRGIGFRLDVKS